MFWHCQPPSCEKLRDEERILKRENKKANKNGSMLESN